MAAAGCARFARPVDLRIRTGALRAHDSRDNITRLVHVVCDPNANEPPWGRFLDDVRDGDQEMQTSTA